MRSLCLITIVILSPSLGVFAEEKTSPSLAHHTPGDKVLSMSVGMLGPLFTVATSPAKGASSLGKTKLFWGGSGSLLFDVYLTENIIVGGELAGAFNKGPNRPYLYTLPLLVRGGWEFYLNDFLSLPVMLGLGVAFLTYDPLFHIDFILKPSVALRWQYREDWSFQFSLSYWTVHQTTYTQSEFDRIGHFMRLALAASYHF